MRIQISHRTLYQYATPAKQVTQVLRLTPRNHEGQRVGSWRIDVDADCSLRTAEDAFGNLTQTFVAVGPLSSLTVCADGEVETFDTAGVARGAIERLPPEIYLRPTDLTLPDDSMREIASAIISAESDPLGRLHSLMAELCKKVARDPDPNGVPRVSAHALSAGHGTCHDHAHVFIACARLMEIPARYVSGYYISVEGEEAEGAGHAWAEAYVNGLGWVGFDSVHDICPQEGHLSLARGLDYLGAAPVRGARSGGDGEKSSVKIRVSRAEGQQRY